MMHNTKITFIGGGNMATSLISGLCASHYPPQYIRVSDPSADKLTGFSELYGIQAFVSNTTAAADADIIILAVKPGLISTVCAELKPIIEKNRPLIISVAAGINLAQLAQLLGEKTAIVRVMPNISAQVLHGASGLCANQHVSPLQHQQAEQILKAVGIVAWFTDEQALHAITALSGSGVAYYFLFMEAMADAAAELGLSKEIAEQFSAQTALGAAQLVAASGLRFSELRTKVATPNGTTAAAIDVMQQGDIHGLMRKAMQAAYQRSKELTKEGT